MLCLVSYKLIPVAAFNAISIDKIITNSLACPIDITCVAYRIREFLRNSLTTEKTLTTEDTEFFIQHGDTEARRFKTEFFLLS